MSLPTEALALSMPAMGGGLNTGLRIAVFTLLSMPAKSLHDIT
jgi:hypothetical protein